MYICCKSEPVLVLHLHPHIQQQHTVYYAEQPAVKLQILIHTQLFFLFKMQIESAAFTLMGQIAFASQIVQGN